MLILNGKFVRSITILLLNKVYGKVTKMLIDLNGSHTWADPI